MKKHNEQLEGDMKYIKLLEKRIIRTKVKICLCWVVFALYITVVVLFFLFRFKVL